MNHYLHGFPPGFHLALYCERPLCHHTALRSFAVSFTLFPSEAFISFLCWGQESILQTSVQCAVSDRTSRPSLRSPEIIDEWPMLCATVSTGVKWGRYQLLLPGVVASIHHLAGRQLGTCRCHVPAFGAISNIPCRVCSRYRISSHKTECNKRHSTFTYSR